MPDSGSYKSPSQETQRWRLPEGGQIDRRAVRRFSFDGQQLVGYTGDTLASALLGNGIKLVGRSFKYHRPRGILTADSAEPNALVELRAGAWREPNTRATTAELYDGLLAVSQNRFPSLRFDLLAVNSLLSPVFAAGFYYKTFMWPASFWEKLYEPMIRRAAGLGRNARVADPDSYEKITAFCDVLVIGAGPAGLAAGLAAGRAGARVIICDDDFAAGGRLLSDRRMVGDLAGSGWSNATMASLADMPGVKFLSRTTVFGVYDSGTYGAVERVTDHLAGPAAHQPRQRYWKIVARRSVLATGAIERPLLFGNNDLPGVMLAGAVRSYINRYAVLPGQRAVVFANNDDAAMTISDLASAGITVSALVDSRTPVPQPILDLAARLGTPVFAGSVVWRACGKQSLTSVEIITANGAIVEIPCDLLAMSGGWSSAVHLTSHLDGKPVWNDNVASFVPGTLPPGMAVAGAASGAFSLADALYTGSAAGGDAALACGFAAPPIVVPVLPFESTSVTPLWQIPATFKAGPQGKIFVDFQNDVTVNDVAVAKQEGFRAVEHLKRYTTLGMATDQGKTANVNGLAVMASLTGTTIAETGTTRFRPPYTPVAIGALAGHHRGKNFRPIRLPPTHQWATEQGAVFVETGLWLRAQYFPRAGEADWLTTVCREVNAVRSGVGFCDVTTLGKIDIQGVDAAKFLDRVYTNSWAALPVGRVRYGLMLREDGFVMDDGTTARLAADRFVMTTTTANAAKVFQHLEFCHQWLWPELDVQMISVTDQWAQISVAGPRSRDTLRKLIDPGFDISNEAFTAMQAGEITVHGGIRARLFRLSFSGELAYEIAVPARHGDNLARWLMQAGAEFGITPYGLEALGVMRIEKGHPAGSEINGTTTAHDLGMGKLLSKKKDFIGRALAARAALTDPMRPRLIGLRPIDRTVRLRAGAHLLAKGAPCDAAHDDGYVTSVAYSPGLSHWIGLGLLANGPARLGEVIRVFDPVRDGDTLAEVVSPVFYDPTGGRANG